MERNAVFAPNYAWGEPTIRELMERLKPIARTQTIKGVVEWLGVSYHDYKNWRYRKVIPYKLLIRKLMNEGISIDWLLAPGVKLLYPKTTPELAENLSSLTSEQDYRFYWKAMQMVEPTLKKHYLENSEAHRNELLNVYFLAQEGWVKTEVAMGCVARAMRRVSRPAAQEREYG